MKKNVSGYVDEDVKNKLDRFTDKEQRSASQSINMLLKLAFKTMEENGIEY